MPVPAGASSGPLVATVGGTTGNSVNFTVLTNPPTITASALPPANAAGWNNSNVVLTYSCTPGGASIPNSACPQPQTVSTEGANQQITATVTDSAGATGSVSTTLNIDKTPPVLALNPSIDGAVVTSSTLTLTGTATDSLSGLSAITCNGTSVPVTTGGFSCNISLSPGVNLVVVRATDVAGNIAASISHVTLNAPFPPPTSLQITPSGINMLVGQSQQFTAVDQTGHSRPDASWSIDNTSIATLDTNTPSLLTAVASGTATLTASLGSVSAQTTVTVLSGTSFPIGTIQWSAPSVPGFTTQQILQAVPTANSPDLFSVDQDSNGNLLIRGFTADGQQLSNTPLSTAQYGLFGPAMPDGFGGVLVQAFGSSSAVLDIDGQSGALAFTSTLPLPASTFLLGAVGSDGSIYVTGTDTLTQSAALFKINPSSGQFTKIFSVTNTDSIEVGTCTGPSPGTPSAGGSQTSFSAGGIGSPIVDATGAVLFTVASRQSFTPLSCVEGDPTQGTTNTTYQVSVVRLAPDGTSSKIALPISDPASTLPSVGALAPLADYGINVVAPDGSGGVLATWPTGPSSARTFMMMSTSSGSAYPAPLNTPGSVVLGENGNAFSTDGSSVTAFDPLAGSIQWGYKPSQGVNSLYAAHEGGLTILDGNWNQISVDSSGQAGTIGQTGEALATPVRLGSWSGLSNTQLVGFSGIRELLPSSEWPSLNGSLTAQNASPKLSIQTFWAAVTISSNPENDPRFGDDARARRDLQSQIPQQIANQRIFMRSNSPSRQPTVDNFLLNILSDQLDVVGFIGHATVISSTPDFANGLQLSDNVLQRSPNCSDPRGPVFCYDTVAGADLIPLVLSSAPVVFVAACDTGPVFTTWWDLSPSTVPNGGALVVPDLSRMAQNAGVQQLRPGDVDLVQGAVGWEAFVNSLAMIGHSVETAKDDANKAIANIYPALVFPPGQPRPVQVFFTVVGNSNICPRCLNHP